MRMVDVIQKKRDGEALSKEEIEFFVDGYTDGSIRDYQASAFLMATYFSDMNAEEQGYLTMAMANSGDQIDLSAIEGIKVDKHSTGGVGDTTTLILAPLVAACGVPVAKMSGRGLGHTGGTLDKLEAIEGFHVEITEKEFVKQVNDLKLAVIGQSGNLTPADKKLYALRDVTATVDSIPLIASSIMSKKIAAGADAIVLDVKTGDGAFMKTPEDAEELARSMVAIGNEVGRHTIAVISDMSQPLGFAIGNALEVKEAIETLKGTGPDDLTELCLVLGSKMLIAGGKAKDTNDARSQLKRVIEDGSALELFGQFLQAQGGNADIVKNPDLLPNAAFQIEVKSTTTGFITKMEADEIGVAAMLLGAGRATKEDDIDLAVGIVLKKKIGDSVKSGETLAIVHSNQPEIVKTESMLLKHIHISQHKPKRPKLIHKILD
ncbi:pyrimidine-nucleoside phosphorylase [Sporosarcina aquimarina]|uniref:Pyrimidine-nucleoside phosphorylase n=1 Tax=Sporosarcina aquimarina TaxID=114975 RepID=A0ABU4FWP3_9BACL|nr:pyrimidine-nucleoside phosphorylase [Sporosarcina aquimarina]MDW0109124.1 pyrimidine-nucleoside phosphorylase [Sporosarcina aquimarina]